MDCEMGAAEKTGRGKAMNHTAVMVACCFVVSLSGSLSRAQSTRSLVHEGNDLYEQDKFTDAEVSYRKALEKDP